MKYTFLQFSIKSWVLLLMSRYINHLELVGEENTIDCHVTVAHFKAWNILGSESTNRLMYWWRLTNVSCTVGRRKIKTGSVIIWWWFDKKPLGHGNHMDLTAPCTESTAADQEHPVTVLSWLWSHSLRWPSITTVQRISRDSLRTTLNISHHWLVYVIIIYRVLWVVNLTLNWWSTSSGPGPFTVLINFY